MLGTTNNDLEVECEEMVLCFFWWVFLVCLLLWLFF